MYGVHRSPPADGDYSALMPACRMTVAHFATSVLIWAALSSEVPARGSKQPKGQDHE
jgi:hypothetical protein